MKLTIIIIALTLHLTAFAAETDPPKRTVTDANIFGHVLDAETGKHLPFVSIGIRGTTIGTVTDQTGHYLLVNAPVGMYILQASFTGYKPKEILISTEAGKTIEIDFELEPDILRLDEVVISASRYSRRRTESPVMTSNLTPKLFTNVQALVLSEGLNFSPGLRMETNCSNCGFNQVRMNGLEGAYSQILINGRPIFSGLAAVYGLELIPANMIERIEVVRGGGSVLHGGSVIAGTINLKLRDPISNTYEAGSDLGFTGVGMKNADKISQDAGFNANVSAVSDDRKSGLSLFGFSKTRDAFDANNDGFSEMVQLKNTSFGTRAYQRLSNRSKLTFDFFRIAEQRRGGNSLDAPEHVSDIAESVAHRITTSALTFEQFFRETDVLTVHVSVQNVARNSYYGANQSLSAYGITNDLSVSSGAAYSTDPGKGKLIVGTDFNFGKLKDQKPAYLDLDNAVNQNGTLIIPYIGNSVLARQNTATTGIFSQYDFQIKRWNFSAGIRIDHYNIQDKLKEAPDYKGFAFVPRLNLLYNFNPYLQGRLGYASGYRVPQIFNEDLHIEASGSRRVVLINNPGLEREKSNSLMTSLSYARMLGRTSFELILEGFYTQLSDPFVIEFGEPDDDGTVIFARSNAGKSAVVQGLNVELNMNPQQRIDISAGFTIQSSRYTEEHEFGEIRFFRSPDMYGFFSMDWKLMKNTTMSTSGTYTGRMLVPYFGPELEDPDLGELRKSKAFFDFGFKINQEIKINGSLLNLYTGVRNLFNSYQSDFDRGINRDPGYVYGPSSPRVVYLGLKFGLRTF